MRDLPDLLKTYRPRLLMGGAKNPGPILKTEGLYGRQLLRAVEDFLCRLVEAREAARNRSQP